MLCSPTRRSRHAIFSGRSSVEDGILTGGLLQWTSNSFERVKTRAILLRCDAEDAIVCPGTPRQVRPFSRTPTIIYYDLQKFIHNHFRLFLSASRPKSPVNCDEICGQHWQHASLRATHHRKLLFCNVFRRLHAYQMGTLPRDPSGRRAEAGNFGCCYVQKPSEPSLPNAT